MKIGLFASGNLGFTTVRSLFESGFVPAFLFTDRGSSALISFCERHSIPFFKGNPREGRGIKFLQHLGGSVDLVCSINYLFLVEENLISFPKLGCINIHGSLLPRYRGRSPHVWSIINNEKKIGITVHYIDEGCDTGAIVLQQEYPIFDSSTGGDLMVLFEQQYPILIREAIRLFEVGPPTGTKQDESKATLFGKRTPEDGLINWDWQKERLFNWVRAQSDPYPGAFSYYCGQRVVIDWISFSERGFDWEMPNGLIVSGGDHPEVKTPNGVIRIDKVRGKISMIKGEVLK